MYIPQIWLGTEESYSTYLQNATRYLDNPSLFEGTYRQKLQNLQLMWDDEDEDDDDEDESRPSIAKMLAKSLITKVDNVGVFTIDGPMSRETGFMELFFGGVGYDAVAEGVNLLLEDEEVEKILIDFATPGGDASGVHEAAKYLQAASRVKPVTGFTSDIALSAGYWLASATQRISMGEMAEVGSVGAIMTFTSVARSLKERGIDVHIQRSGSEKAVLHPAEPLTEKGRAMMEAKTAHIHGVFIDNIVRNRPTLGSVPLNKWAEGATYFYTDALALGLADRGPVDLNTLLSEMTADYRSESYATSGERDMTKKIVLTESAKAALASGAALADVKPDTELQAEPETPAEPEGETIPEPTSTDAPAAAAAAGAEGGVLLEAKEDGLTAYLQATVDKQATRIETLNAELHDAKSQLTVLQGADAALRPVAVEAIQKLQVALGQKPSKNDGVSATALAEMYGSLREELNERYPTGRTSVDTGDDSKQPRDPRIARLEMVAGGKG